MKLSNAQQRVIETLKNNKDSYIKESRFYNHNNIHDKNGGFLMQFTKKTLDSLIKKKLLIKLLDKVLILNTNN